MPKLTRLQAIGGSAMVKGGAAWSKMASTQSNRKAFIDSLMQFLGQWNFKSVEIHWEWPSGSDTQNHVSLMRELREGLGKDFGITVVVPPRDVLLKNIDLKGMEDSVHWFTFLAFDLHGPWDGFTIKPHTDLAEIDSALNLLSSTNLAPRRINLGIANYGRGFTVADKDCMYYGCETTSPSKPGSCTKEQGLLSACEIGRIIQEKNLSPQIIKGGAGVKEITWDDQWINYDDADTLALKLELANKHCLGGTSLWAIDYSQCDGMGGPPQLPGSSSASGPSPSASSNGPSSAAPSQASTTPSSAVSNGQPSSEAGSSSSAPTNTGSSASGSSVAISSGASSSAQSSAPVSSGVESSSPVSSVQGSTSGTPGFTATTTSGASNSLTESSTDDSSSAGSTATATSGSSNTPTQSSDDGPFSTGSSASDSPIPGSSAAESSAFGSSEVPSSTNDGSSVWLSTASGSEPSSDSSASWTGTFSGSPSSVSPSSDFSGSPTGSASPSDTWGSSVSTAPSSEPQDSSEAGFSTQWGSSTGPDSSVAHTSGGSSQAPSSSGQPSDTSTTSNGPSPIRTGSSATQSSNTGDLSQGPSRTSQSGSSSVASSQVVSSSEPSPTSDGDPDLHSDSDPNCQPNDCVKDCAAWNVITFLATKRPFCPCVPKKCDKDGDSDSPSDSDDDDPMDKPKPTSIPKEKSPKCKLLGCGCGWMGLGFGPGCPGMEIGLDVPCGLFGCDPCIFFGCPGTNPKGLIGWDGYCLGEGCDPCPPELCKLPDCTIPGGCGPKPGPAPTKPVELPDPEECDDSKRTVITERFVWCTEGLNVSALPSSMRETSSTMISSMCLPMIDATVTVCGGVMPGFDITTTQTGKNTLTSDAPACTRAPLSLDDDECNNNPDDPLSTSSTYASNKTTASSTKTSSSSKSSSKSSSTSSTTKTSFVPSYPSLGRMDRKGRWKVKLNQYMNRDYSEVKWQLFDPNGNHAGENKVSGKEMENLQDTIRSVNRPEEHSMPFDVKLWVQSPGEVDDCYISFQFPEIWRCDKNNYGPMMESENYIEDKPFKYRTCEDVCDDGFDPPLITGDLWCQDLNDADWYQDGSGWRRDFECGWKGFRPNYSGPI